MLVAVGWKNAGDYTAAMDYGDLDLEDLWIPDPNGRNVFTFFRYPRTIADELQLPCDSEALRFLAAIQGRGIPVGVWGHPVWPDEYYFVCPGGNLQRLMTVIAELEELGIFPQDFINGKEDYLFSLVPTAP
jgi:hypothetical protein